MEKVSEGIIGGFYFEDASLMQEAESEQRKIQYLESKIDYKDLPRVQAIYEKALQDQVFHTPVGLFYLKGIRDFLVNADERLDKTLSPINMALSLKEGAKTRTADGKRNKEQQLKKKAEKNASNLKLSIILNLLLIAAVIAMYAITLNAKQPNILNYEKALVNRYSAWEQELTRREQVVRQKEKELKISDESNE